MASDAAINRDEVSNKTLQAVVARVPRVQCILAVTVGSSRRSSSNTPGRGIRRGLERLCAMR